MVLGIVFLLGMTLGGDPAPPATQIALDTVRTPIPSPSTVEEVAEVAKRQPHEPGPAHRGGDIKQAGPQPERRQHQADRDLRIALRRRIFRAAFVAHVVSP